MSHTLFQCPFELSVAAQFLRYGRKMLLNRRVVDAEPLRDLCYLLKTVFPFHRSAITLCVGQPSGIEEFGVVVLLFPSPSKPFGASAVGTG